MKHSFISDTKLQVDQIKKKVEESSLSHYLFKNQLFSKVKTTIRIQVKKINALVWSCLETKWTTAEL